MSKIEKRLDEIDFKLEVLNTNLASDAELQFVRQRVSEIDESLVWLRLEIATNALAR